MRARRLLFVLATLAAAGCAAVFGIEDGHLLAGADGGDDGGGAESSVPPPPPTNPGDDAGPDSGGDSGCPRTVVELVPTADTFVDLSAGGSAAYGDLSSVNIGFQDASALFRYDIDAALVPSLGDSTIIATFVVTEMPGMNGLNLTDGPIAILAATSNWDELTASFDFRDQSSGAGVPWADAGIGGSDRGPVLGGGSITGLRPDAATTYEIPLGYFPRAKNFGWISGTELTLLAIPDPDSGAAHLRMFALARKTASPAKLRISFCTP